MDPAEKLSSLGILYKAKSAEYGELQKTHGAVMLGLFPDGVKLCCNADFERYGVVVQMVNKLARYCHNFNRKGHQDSLDDLAVYSAMLGELDEDNFRH